MPATTLQISGVTYYQVQVTIFDKLADLRTVPPANNGNWTDRAIAYVFGSAAFNDGNFFVYAWIPTSTAADSSPTVIKPTAITGAGRWELISWNNSGQSVVNWLSGASSPVGTGLQGVLGQYYFQTDGSCAVYHFDGTDWCG